MELGCLGFVNDVGMKKEWIPQPRATWFALPGKKTTIKDDEEQAMDMLETKAL
jgi:hypothetical protein